MEEFSLHKSLLLVIFSINCPNLLPHTRSTVCPIHFKTLPLVLHDLIDSALHLTNQVDIWHYFCCTSKLVVLSSYDLILLKAVAKDVLHFNARWCVNLAVAANTDMTSRSTIQNPKAWVNHGWLVRKALTSHSHQWPWFDSKLRPMRVELCVGSLLKKDNLKLTHICLTLHSSLTG